MSEGTVGLLVFAGITVAASVAWHWFSKSYVFATIGATLTSDVLFQLAAYLHQGFLDPFFEIAIAITGLIAFFAALLVGMPLRAWKESSAKQQL